MVVARLILVGTVKGIDAIINTLDDDSDGVIEAAKPVVTKDVLDVDVEVEYTTDTTCNTFAAVSSMWLARAKLTPG